MTAIEFETQIKKYDIEIADLKGSITDLKAQILEAEMAQKNAKGLREGFDGFVSSKKQKNCRTTNGNHIKAFMSFINKATVLLTGPEYNRAKDSVEEINRLLIEKLKKLNSDLDYCSKRLGTLQVQRQELNSQYVNFLNAQKSEEVNNV